MGMDEQPGKWKVCLIMAASLELDDLSSPFLLKPSDDSVILWFSFLSPTHVFCILPLSVLVGQTTLPAASGWPTSVTKWRKNKELQLHQKQPHNFPLFTLSTVFF